MNLYAPSLRLYFFVTSFFIFSYFERLHIARMAGCFNKIWDDVDEQELTPAQTNSLIYDLFPNIQLPIYRDEANVHEYRKILKQNVENYGKVLNAKGRKQYILDVDGAVANVFGLRNSSCCCM